MFNTAEKLFVVVLLTTYLFEIFHACISHETFNFQSVDHWRYAEASESSFIQGGIEEAKQGEHDFDSFLNPQDSVNQQAIPSTPGSSQALSKCSSQVSTKSSLSADAELEQILGDFSQESSGTRNREDKLFESDSSIDERETVSRGQLFSDALEGNYFQAAQREAQRALERIEPWQQEVLAQRFSKWQKEVNEQIVEKINQENIDRQEQSHQQEGRIESDLNRNQQRVEEPMEQQIQQQIVEDPAYKVIFQATPSGIRAQQDAHRCFIFCALTMLLPPVFNPGLDNYKLLEAVYTILVHKLTYEFGDATGNIKDVLNFLLKETGLESSLEVITIGPRVYTYRSELMSRKIDPSVHFEISFDLREVVSETLRAVVLSCLRICSIYVSWYYVTCHFYCIPLSLNLRYLSLLLSTFIIVPADGTSLVKVIVVFMVVVLCESVIPNSWSADLMVPSAVRYVGFTLLSAVTPEPMETVSVPSLIVISCSCINSSTTKLVVEPSAVNVSVATLLLLITYLSMINDMFLNSNALSLILFLTSSEVPVLQ